MAVVPMEHLYLCGLKSDRKQLLEQLQRLGAVETADLLQEDNVFMRQTTEDVLQHFDKRISVISRALSILDNYAPAKESMLASLAGRDVLNDTDYASFKDQKVALNGIASRLVTLEKTAAEASAQILKQQSKLDAIQPWLNLPVPMSFDGTRTTTAIIGSVPGQQSAEAICTGIMEANPKADPFDLQIISESKDMTCILVLCPKSIGSVCEEALRSIGFTRPSSLPKTIPAEYQQKLEQRIATAEEEKKKAVDEIVALSENRKNLKYLMDDYALRKERNQVTGKLLQSKNTFILTGYIPVTKEEEICRQMEDQFTVTTWTEAIREDEDVPVLLKNNGFSSPMEGVLESFSLPGKNEVDPSGVMAIFYYFLFGLMLSDFAYGFILFLGAALMLWKFPNMESGLKKNVRMFRNCGVSTMFWGVLFSSYFGDVVTVVAKTFFGADITIPALWFVPLNEPMRMLVFCMLVGVIHLFAGLAMGLYQFCKQKRYYDAFCDIILWYGLVGGLIVILLSMDMFTQIFQLSISLPPMVVSVATVITCLSAIGIVLTAGRSSKNWVKRILKGAYGLYNVTGYLSDILSYSRLLALGLATGVIASVINQMGAMAGGGIVGAILFIIVFVAGHSINLGINALGAYVHTNRLQFVEFFGKFYEGGGRPFRPFGVHTKFFKFKEDNRHE